MSGNDKKTDAVEAEVFKEILPAQPMGPQAVTVGPKQLRKQMQTDQEIRAVINDYIKNNMVEGKDYGTIEVTSKSGKKFTSKPSLFKPGAEKFCGLFKIRPTFKKDPETVEMLGNTPGIVAYICELVDTRGRVIGEGRGTSTVDPKAADFDVNKAVKIAEKRSQIDAVLRTGGLSDFFTQDMEDALKGNEPSSTFGTQTQAPVTVSAMATDKQTNLINRLVSERFEDELEFAYFAQETVKKKDGFTVKEASTLIEELFKLPKLEGDNEDSY